MSSSQVSGALLSLSRRRAGSFVVDGAEALLLDGGEEALGHGIIEAIGGSAAAAG